MTAPRCPLHGSMQLEDVDSAYGQEFWTCRARLSEGCREEEMSGPDDHDIAVLEQGVSW